MTSVVNPNAESSPPWQTYLSVADDVAPWLQMDFTDIQPGTQLEMNLELITGMACEWVQEQLGQPVPPTRFTRRFDGWSSWNGAYLELPYYPVLAIENVTEYWGVSGPHVLSESTPTEQIDGWQCEWLTGRLTRVFPGNVQKPWFPGSRNVEVTWSAGQNPIRKKIIVGTLELIAHWWRNTQQQEAFREGVTAQNEYDPANDTAGPFEGVPDRVRTMLGLSMQVGIG